MSFFGANALKPVTTTKRKEVRTVSQPPPTRSVATRNGLSKSHAPTQVGQPLPKTASRPPSMEDRYKMTASTKKRMSSSQLRVARTTLKRKSETPQPAPLSSDSEGEDETQPSAEEEHRRKRMRAPDTPPDPSRRLRDIGHWNKDEPATLDIIHSQELTSGPKAKGFFPIFPSDPDAEILLQYPSCTQPERFRIYTEQGHDAYNSLDDLRHAMETVLKFYLPPSLESTALQSDTGIRYHLSPTKKLHDLPTIRNLVDTLNTLVKTAITTGTIAERLDTLTSLPLPIIDRIMSQTYTRTISPNTELLKKYTTGSDNTYGELKPIFCSDIFKETSLTSSKVFLDLGSGVGNVVIQAALETGAECWGIESVSEWHDLAEVQAKEFIARSRLWGLSAGSVNLLCADFLNCPTLTQLLPRADVIIVNNFKFSSATNDNLKTLFLDLKEGAKVVSLRSFVSGELRERNRDDVGNAFEVLRKFSSTNAVSWEGDEVQYFVATKDSGRIERILKEGRTRGR